MAKTHQFQIHPSTILTIVRYLRTRDKNLRSYHQQKGELLKSREAEVNHLNTLQEFTANSISQSSYVHILEPKIIPRQIINEWKESNASEEEFLKQQLSSLSSPLGSKQFWSSFGIKNPGLEVEKLSNPIRSNF